MIDFSSSSPYVEDLEFIAAALIDLNFQADILDLQIMDLARLQSQSRMKYLW
jgi:hypothetical protein